jgi:anti-anti-sigma regulatory factor
LDQVTRSANGSATVTKVAIHALHGGYYDVSRKSELQAEFDAIEPHSDVVIDLATTEHLDCACLGVMVGRLGEWRVRKPETQLRLRNVAPQLARVLGILKLNEVFIVE